MPARGTFGVGATDRRPTDTADSNATPPCQRTLPHLLERARRRLRAHKDDEPQQRRHKRLRDKLEVPARQQHAGRGDVEGGERHRGKGVAGDGRHVRPDGGVARQQRWREQRHRGGGGAAEHADRRSYPQHEARRRAPPPAGRRRGDERQRDLLEQRRRERQEIPVRKHGLVRGEPDCVQPGGGGLQHEVADVFADVGDGQRPHRARKAEEVVCMLYSFVCSLCV